jgi:hypothetical protein
MGVSKIFYERGSLVVLAVAFRFAILFIRRACYVDGGADVVILNKLSLLHQIL